MDWERFAFRDDLPRRSLFGNIHVAEAYRARWRAVREIKDDFMRVEKLGRWLERHRTCEPASDFLIRQMAWTCIRHFRKDVLSSIRTSVRPECREGAVEGKFTLCRANLDRILIADGETGQARYRLASGNKMAHKDLDGFIDFLWDFDDKVERKHWRRKGYRMLYERCVKLITASLDANWAASFMRFVKDLFPIANWILPYPNSTVFWQHTKQGERMWLSVFHADVHDRIRHGSPVEWEELLQAQKEACWEIGRGLMMMMISYKLSGRRLAAISGLSIYCH